MCIEMIYIEIWVLTGLIVYLWVFLIDFNEARTSDIITTSPVLYLGLSILFTMLLWWLLLRDIIQETITVFKR